MPTCGYMMTIIDKLVVRMTKDVNDLQQAIESRDVSDIVENINGAVWKLLDALAKHDSVATAHHFAHSVLKLYPILPNMSESISRRAIASTKWFLKLFMKASDDDNVLMISALSTLAYYSSLSKKASAIYARSLAQVMNVIFVEKLVSGIHILSKDATNSEKIICLLSFVYQISDTSELSSIFLDLFSKSILFSKTRPQQFVVEQCGSFLSRLSMVSFQEQLLPQIKKAILRSPEIAMYGVHMIFKHVQFSIDSYAEDIMKGITPSLTSADNNLQIEAVSVAVTLTLSANPVIIAKIMNKLFDQLGGAKSVEHRITLLKGIAHCANTKTENSSDLDKVADDVISKTAKADKDTHEAFVTSQWEAAVAWAMRLTGPTPSLINIFRDAPKLSPSVRYIGYRSLANIISARNLDKLPEGTDNVLWAELNCAQKDAVDSIALSLVLLKTSIMGSTEHTKVWSKAANNDNLFKDRSLSSMNWKDGLLWAELVEKLILERPKSSGPISYPLTAQRSLCLLLFWPHWEVRKRAFLTLRRILSVEESYFAEVLADTMYMETVNGFIDQSLRKISNCPDSTLWTVPGEWYVQVREIQFTQIVEIVYICGNDYHGICRFLEFQFISALIFQTIQNSKMIDHFIPVEVDGSVWLRWMHGQTDSTRWENSETFRETTISRVLRCEQRNVRDNALITLVALNVPTVRAALWKHVEDSIAELDSSLYVKVTERDMAIYQRPDGQLYNTDVLDLYIIIILEIIREELRILYEKAESKLDEARAMIAADHHGAFLSFLVSQEASRMFLAYRDAAFPHSEDYLDELVGSTWLRVIGSRWYDSKWVGESLSAALRRTFDLLNERAFTIDIGDGDGQNDAFEFEEVVGAPQLTLLFPMIKAILFGDYAENIKEAALVLLQNAIHKRFLKDNAVLQLPMVEFADLLLTYYSNTLATPALQTLIQLVALANDSEDASLRVLSMVCSALSYLKNENPDVRESVIMILSAPQLLTRLVLSSDESFIQTCLVRLLVARFDSVENVAEMASRLWFSSHFHLKTMIGESLIEECVSPIGFIRHSAAKAIVAYIDEFPQEMKTLLTKLDEIYTDLSEVRGAVFDEVGRLQRDVVDEWERRSGVGVTLGYLALLVDDDHAEQLIRIVILIQCSKVVPRGLDDRHPECRYPLRDAAVETIRRHGKTIMPRLLPFLGITISLIYIFIRCTVYFQVILEHLSDTTPEGGQHDNMRQGLVVLLGTLAQYIEPSSNKVRAIVGRLMEALSTPSQTVQESVSRCLSPLVPAIRDTAKDLVGKLQWLLFEADSYGQRRGAAYGIAGLVKGMGMASLKELDLLPVVHKALLEKKNAKHREGGLLALEILCSTIGKLFEPYMIQALPSLLLCFGDNDEDVRKAAETELLGSMAFCAPRQLSACLPNIVPKLIEVLADSSSKVQNSGEKALRQIARVVRNPEILGVTNQLMTGLLDPASKTSSALQAVLNTKFIHYIDAPSLALMMPIVRRAFEDRNSETRRVAAQIIANIYTLTEHKDMEPYLCELVPGLQKSLLDPVPEIRTVAARALGAIVAKSSGTTSERLRETIIPWLKEKLISPQSTVDRSGAAQGLCEVLAGVGTEQLEFVMPEIIAATESTEVSAETRDGYILMYIYLPMVFGDKFLPYLPRVVPPILKALADENEYVRASALKAGQRLIAQYCSHARRLLLPQLQTALMDENWRIRHASVQLIGDFLFNISGKCCLVNERYFEVQQKRNLLLLKVFLEKVLHQLQTKMIQWAWNKLVKLLCGHLDSSAEIGFLQASILLGGRFFSFIVRRTPTDGCKMFRRTCWLKYIVLKVKSDEIFFITYYSYFLFMSRMWGMKLWMRSSLLSLKSLLPIKTTSWKAGFLTLFIFSNLNLSFNFNLSFFRQMLPCLLPRLTKSPINVHALCSLAAVAGYIALCLAILFKGFVLFYLYCYKSLGRYSYDQKDLELDGSTSQRSTDSRICPSKGASATATYVKRGNSPGYRIWICGVELKALSGETLGMIVSVSEPEALKSHVVSITGPLIRVLGDRYPASVKLAILETLSRLLDKVHSMLRPFLPQLQSTFVKALQEPSSRPVRLAAGGALARLLPIHPRPEPLVVEIFKLLANCQDQSLMETTFVAARALISGCGAKLTAQTIQEGFRVCELQFMTALENYSEMDTSLTICSGALFGELAVKTGSLDSQSIMIDVESCSKLRVRHAKAVALQQMCKSDAAFVWSKANASCRTAIVAAFTAEPMIASAALRAATHILIRYVYFFLIPPLFALHDYVNINQLFYSVYSIILSEGSNPDRILLSAMARAFNHQSVEVRRVVSVAFGHVFEKVPEQLGNDQLKLVIPHLVNGAKESNTAVRSGSELALVYAFKFHKGSEGLEVYKSCLEGTAKSVLDEIQTALRRVVKSGDLVLENIDNIPSKLDFRNSWVVPIFMRVLKFLCKRQYTASGVVRARQEFHPVIGLEVHVQLKSRSKLFSRAPCGEDGGPNSRVAPLDMACPGTLPILNKQCVMQALRMAVLFSCEVPPVCRFDRKHYFYADMPAGYQITQSESPIARNGIFRSFVYGEDFPTYSKEVYSRILVHISNILHKQLEFFLGAALVEVVTTPCFSSAVEAVCFVQQLRLLLIHHRISEGEMHKGHMRIDANISLSQGSTMGVKTEVKNINSMRHLHTAINFEINRQYNILSTDGTVVNETRACDAQGHVY
uniref:TOG domain-containing protein n=1 Tax=Heterorhabditis bacteriophora TaxID=37862 RepID=A0A1I7XTF0_HETBA